MTRRSRRYEAPTSRTPWGRIALILGATGLITAAALRNGPGDDPNSLESFRDINDRVGAIVEEAEKADPTAFEILRADTSTRVEKILQSTGQIMPDVPKPSGETYGGMLDSGATFKYFDSGAYIMYGVDGKNYLVLGSDESPSVYDEHFGGKPVIVLKRGEVDDDSEVGKAFVEAGDQVYEEVRLHQGLYQGTLPDGSYFCLNGSGLCLITSLNDEGEEVHYLIHDADQNGQFNGEDQLSIYNVDDRDFVELRTSDEMRDVPKEIEAKYQQVLNKAEAELPGPDAVSPYERISKGEMDEMVMKGAIPSDDSTYVVERDDGSALIEHYHHGSKKVKAILSFKDGRLIHVDMTKK